jgi:hypothetical protein
MRISLSGGRSLKHTARSWVLLPSKPKTDAQIIKWLKDPHSDSAEYKLWGNGVALPCVCFVLAGIVYYSPVSRPIIRLLFYSGKIRYLLAISVL